MICIAPSDLCTNRENVVTWAEGKYLLILTSKFYIVLSSQLECSLSQLKRFIFTARIPYPHSYNDSSSMVECVIISSITTHIYIVRTPIFTSITSYLYFYNVDYLHISELHLILHRILTSPHPMLRLR